MSFTDAVSAYRVPYTRCSIAVWRDAQPEDVRAEFDEAVRSGASNKAIWLAMTTYGFAGSTQSVNRHRRGDCQCPSLTK